MLSGLRAVVLGSLAWVLVAASAGLVLWPSIPKSSLGWLTLLVLGPPLYLLGEAFSSWLWSTRPARALSEHPSSALRILVGVVVGGLLMTAIFAVSIFLQGR